MAFVWKNSTNLNFKNAFSTEGEFSLSQARLSKGFARQCFFSAFMRTAACVDFTSAIQQLLRMEDKSQRFFFLLQFLIVTVATAQHNPEIFGQRAGKYSA